MTVCCSVLQSHVCDTPHDTGAGSLATASAAIVRAMTVCCSVLQSHVCDTPHDTGAGSLATACTFLASYGVGCVIAMTMATIFIGVFFL